MNKAVAIGVISITLLAILTTLSFKQVKTPNIQVQETTVSLPWDPQQCTQKLAVECAADIQLTVKACSKAYETEGADIIADIKCIKDLNADKKHCWPCICSQAKKHGWKVIGC